MKWFKYLTGSLQSPEIYELMNRHGANGYLAFFGTMEIYAREFKPYPDFKLVITHEQLRINLRARTYQLCHNYLTSIHQLCGWEIQITDTHYIIKIPKFNSLLDEHTIRKMKEYETKKSGVNPDTLPTIEEDKEEEEEKEYNPLYIPPTQKLHQAILKNFPKSKPRKIKDDIDDIRKLIELDHRTQEELNLVLDKLMNDESFFWSKQIQSAKALRGKTRSGGDKFSKILSDCTKQNIERSPLEGIKHE